MSQYGHSLYCLPPAPDGQYHFLEGSFLIGTLSKPRLHGPELLLQQHFRWVQLRWDSEPLCGLLGRHLRRKLLHKVRIPPPGGALSRVAVPSHLIQCYCPLQLQGNVLPPSDPLWRSLAWICSVWLQLNGCLARLGTPEALIGPHMFFSCPVVPKETSVIIG